MTGTQNTNDDQLRASIQGAAQDPDLRRSRRTACKELANGFQQAGDLWLTAGNLFGPQRVDRTSPFGNGDDRIVAIGHLSWAAGQLTAGALSLFELELPYGSSALLRQLVEVEYLAWAFAEDQEEAANWLRSTSDERRQRWQPRHLRDRSQGRFRGSDYAQHCEIGGHPTPPGLRTLRQATEPITTELLLADLANHAASTWDYLVAAIVSYCQALGVGPEHLIHIKSAESVRTAVRQWHDSERLISSWNHHMTARDSQ